jgi:hypothetical protein
MKARSLFAIFIALIMLLTAGSAAARPQGAPPPPGTVFTYQGQLTVGGSPANGDYDFAFSLFKDPTADYQIGSTLTQGNVAVTDGLFTVQLDFGEVFDGTALWLEIGVAAGGSGGPYTTLDPRQPITPTPYAMFAGRASSAPWSGLTGVPAGFADGVDNTASYHNVVVVAQSGGDFTTITGALNSITTASDTNRYLVYVAPGVYTERVTMKPYVDIQGSGELTTKITFTGSGVPTTGTLLGADNAELRFLRVENTGGNTNAIAIYNGTSAPHLTHVTASASGATGNTGVFNNSSSSPTMTDVTSSASGGLYNTGVYNSGSSPTMADVTASATGGANNNGVYNYQSSPTMRDVTASGSGGTSGNYGVYNDSSLPTMTEVTASGSGGTDSYGVFNNGSSPTMTSVIASGSGGTSANYGVRSNNSSVTMMSVIASASGGTLSVGVRNNNSSATMTAVSASASGGSTNYGVSNVGSLGVYSVIVNNSQITGSNNTITNDSGFTTRIGGSLLSGGPVSGPGTVTCAGVYDENYVFYASTCP